jgi:hypothetical protein
MKISRLSAAATDERGAVLVIVGAAMLAFVLLAAFVVDAANFYEHKRHLQLQADAAALAGAHAFALAGCSDSTISGDAHKYGGSYWDPVANAVVLEPFNSQVGGTNPANIHVLINSSGYFGDTGAGDNTDPNGSPCNAKYVDIKATEAKLPWFFGFGGLVPRINAHARVSLVQETRSNGALPIAVPNPLPTSAAAIFIDETTSPPTIVGKAQLFEIGPSGSLDLWQSSTTSPVSVTIPSLATGIVIALSGKKNLSLTGTLADICDQTLTDCYDANTDPPTNGLSFIRGYSGVGSGSQPNPPILRSVELFPVNCPSNGVYFANNTSSCTYDLVTRIDAALAGGVQMPKAAQIYAASTPTSSVQLDSSTDPNCGSVAGADPCWHGTLSLPTASGPNAVTITWAETTGCLGATLCTDKNAIVCKSGNGNKCTGTFASPAQRAYSAVTATTGNSSGPVKLLNLCGDTDPGYPACPTDGHHSYLVASTHSFVVTVGLAGTLQNATSVSDPLVSLRVKSVTGQSLDCDPGYTNLKTELALGCRPSYIINTGTPDCSQINTTTLWGSAQPWSCVAVNTGRSPNDVAAGLNQRIFGTDKPPNNWPACSSGLGNLGYNNWPLFVNNGGTDGFPTGDPRILNAFITTYGAFSHVNGTSGSVPIIGFGHFYVTGYTGNGAGFDPPRNCNMDPVPNNDTGLIVGHFIRYIDKLGGTGTAPCDPNSINACVIVMNK